MHTLPIYFDANSTCAPKQVVLDYLTNRLKDGPFANPNSLHHLGQMIHKTIEDCRKHIAQKINCEPEQIIFNSGSSEGISQVFYSLLGQIKNGKNIIITSGIEHAAILDAIEYFVKNFNVQHFVIKTTVDGMIDLLDLDQLIKKYHHQTSLVAVMAANNETGVIQPVEQVGLICKKYDIAFLCDTTQQIGKTSDFNFSKSNITYAVVSGHKIGALIGSGFLVAKDPSLLAPHIFGGGQEKELRGGTQNYIAIETLALAIEEIFKKEHLDQIEKINSARKKFEDDLISKYPQVKIFGLNAPRLCNTTMLSYPGIHGQAIQIELESKNIFVSTTSACSDNEPSTSQVLKSMGVSDAIGRGAVRISLPIEKGIEKNYQHLLLSLEQAFKTLSIISF